MILAPPLSAVELERNERFGVLQRGLDAIGRIETEWAQDIKCSVSPGGVRERLADASALIGVLRSDFVNLMVDKPVGGLQRSGPNFECMELRRQLGMQVCTASLIRHTRLWGPS